ncbi:ATP-binding protein [Polaribacter sp. Hel_I_88]|uniref:ATP-binding protein n=1 Tax=Polaribacter sp. Hel_I_88 TaxID=1250006 RepID=UPI00047A4E8C|nr:ATP-binding protein [Polaribacter sp. Hel_I_88]
MKKTIPFKRILKQLKDDAIGKDSHRGITLTYAWLANQFGHISLGFIPSYLLFYFSNFDAVKSSIYVSGFWLLFELYNFLGPLLSKSESKSDMVFIPKKTTYKFKPKWNNLAFDTFTDVCFFAFGAFLFSLLITEGDNKTVLIVLSSLGIYLLFATRYWFVTKMYQFYARFPFQFRLSQWDFTIDAENKNKVEQFKKSTKKDGNHLLIYGALSTGKTSLGVGILNELSIKNNSCLYVNAFKMFNYFFNDENDVLEEHEIWNWKTTNFLMIDDINPSEPIQDELISPKILLSFIDTLQPINKANRDILKNKNIIWVLGNKQPLKINYEDSWKNMLLEIGIPEEKITTISL